MKIRAATPPDISALAVIWFDGWRRGHAAFVPDALAKLRTLGDFSKRLNEHLSNTICADEGDEIVGFAITRNAELYQLYVSEAAQGAGAAQALLKAGESAIRDAGHGAAHLDCIPENARARAFYKNMGWAESGIEPTTLDTCEGPFSLECLIFRKTL